MELVADSALFPVGVAPTRILRSAFSASILLHAALIGGVSLALSWPKPLEDAGVEAIAVDIVTLEEFTSSSTTENVQSSATVAMQSAGAPSVAAVESTEVAEQPPVETATPVVNDAVEATETSPATPVTPAAVAPVIEAVAAVRPSATPLSETMPVEVTVPLAADTPVVEAVASVQPLAVTASAPISAETVAPVETAVAEATPAAEIPAATVTPKVEAVASVRPAASEAVPVQPTTPAETQVAATNITPAKPITEHVASLEPDTIKPLPEPEPKVEKAEKPVEKKVVEKPAEKPKKDPKPKKKQVAAAGGNGGKSDADAAAANSTASGKGKTGSAGSAAVDKYPGIVQRQLRRALRFPKGAGRARGEVHVQFIVSASGGASNISVVKSSGEAVIDQAAIETVQRAAPFPPIPPEAGRSTWLFTIPLRFSR